MDNQTSKNQTTNKKRDNINLNDILDDNLDDNSDEDENIEIYSDVKKLEKMIRRTRIKHFLIRFVTIIIIIIFILCYTNIINRRSWIA